MNKEKIAILVDSGSDVPKELIEQYQMYEIPLQIIYKERVYTDRVDITPEEVYARFPEEIPSTSLPDGQTIVDMFEKIKADGYEKVIAVTISSGLSGTYNVVRLLAENVEQLETFVLDSKSVGIGSGLLAIEAAKRVAQGWTFSQITEMLTKSVAKNKVFFNVATLEYLQKGGRIGLVASLIGNALKLNPVISCNKEGIYYTVAKARGRKKSLEKTFELVKAFIAQHEHVAFAVVHGQAKEEAEAFFKQLKEQFPNIQEAYFGTISPALVVHTGPGLLAIGMQAFDE